MTAPRSYFVWRRNGCTPFRTYRATRRRPGPAPDDGQCLWRGIDYRAGVRVQRAANATKTRGGRDDPHQTLGLLAGHFAMLAG